MTLQGNPRANVGSAGRAGRLTLPGIILGVGLGGFVDGILLHQVLQWHHMLTSTDTDNAGVPHYPADTVRGLEVNTLWDGLFHAFSWLAVLIGIVLLYSRIKYARGRVWASRVLWGWMLVGWGLFNLVEGLLNHHLLGIHHVREVPNHLWYDIGFLVFGALLVAGGYLLSRSRQGRRVGARAATSADPRLPE